MRKETFTLSHTNCVCLVKQGVAAQLLSWGPQLNTLRLNLEVKSASLVDPVPSSPGSLTLEICVVGLQLMCHISEWDSGSAWQGGMPPGNWPFSTWLPFHAPSHHEWGGARIFP